MPADKNEVRNQLAQFIWSWKGQTVTILMEGFNVGSSVEDTQYTSTQSLEAHAVSFGKAEHTWEAEKVDPEHREFFLELYKAQPEITGELPKIATYAYTKDRGQYKKYADLTGVYITDIDVENSANPFSLKGKALHLNQL